MRNMPKTGDIMYYFIINPKSRSGKGINVWHKVRAELDKQQIPYDYFITKYAGHSTEIVKELCETKPGIKNIVIIGGDGSVNEAINGITTFEDVILGYIPSGSSNDLGRSLKLQKDPLLGLKNILSPAHFGYMDMGLLSSDNPLLKTKFSVSSGMGFDAAVCKEALKSDIKDFLNRFGLGKLTYLAIAVKQILTCPFMNGTIKVDGGPAKTYQNMLMLTTMIQKYEGGGLKLAPTANPRDGKLSICMVYGLPRIKILLLMPTLIFGAHTHFKGVKTFDCENLEIKLDTPAYLHVDGECPGQFSEVRLSCISNKLRFIM
jgi:YegS/Rv2252/BmrU family lipid kinase